MRKFLIYLLLISFLVGVVGFIIDMDFVFAQRELETEYPDIPGVPTPTTTSGIPNYVKYIFNFAIWASGFLALGVLVYGGFGYLTSTGNVEGVRDAKERIASALLGLLILFGSYLILVSINPQLVIFHIPSLYPTFSTLRHGVLVCKEQADVNTAWDLQNEALDPDTSIERKREIKEQLEPLLKKIYEEQCYHISGAGDIQKSFDKLGVHIKYVYFIPKKEDINGQTVYRHYGAIIYEDKNFKGESEISPAAPRANQLIEEPVGAWKISSIRPFSFSELKPGSFAVLYEKIEFNLGERENGGNCFPLRLQAFLIDRQENLETFFNGKSPESIEIKGNYIVVLYTKINLQGESQVFLEPGNYNLNNTKVACWQTCYWHIVPYLCKKSCVKSAFWTRGELY